MLMYCAIIVIQKFVNNNHKIKVILSSILFKGYTFKIVDSQVIFWDDRDKEKQNEAHVIGLYERDRKDLFFKKK